MAAFWDKVTKTAGCWLWGGCVDSFGYGKVYYKGRYLRAHQLAWLLTRGSLPTNFVLHKCDVPACCRPDHLYEGTKKDNAQDRENRSRGNHACGDKQGLRVHPERAPRGSRNGRSKLSEAQVREMLGRLTSGEKKASLARAYGVSKNVVGRIASGKLWKHLDGR